MKKLKILLITDRLARGGAETHIVSLYRELILRDHSVLVVSCGGELSNEVDHVTVDLSSHSPKKIISGYFALRSLILREDFDVIHAHARLPALIASFIARRYKIPLVTTVHARFVLGGVRRALSVWGFRSVAVSEDLRFYLTRNYSVPCENITVIENGIDFSQYKHKDKEDTRIRLLFLSRLDRDCSLCAELLCDIALRLFECYKSIEIIIGGGGECLEDISRRALAINSQVGFELVCVAGEVCDVPKFLSQGDAFVGVSRCALEAVASSLPVIIAGNEGFFGRLTEDNFEAARATNFCARGSDLPTADKLYEAVCETFGALDEAKCDAVELCERAMALMDISLIAPRYEQFYYSAIEDFCASLEGTPKTLLLGYYGFSNLGDDALLYSAIERAHREFGSSVGALTHSPRRCRERFAVSCYSRIMPIGLFRALLGCERLILGGGTLFQDKTSTHSLIYYLFILRLAQLLGKETMLYANGVGEIKNERLRNLLYASLSRCSYIGLRDRASYQLLRSALPSSAPLVLENDLALSLSPSSRSRARYLLHLALKSKAASFFAVCPHGYASPFERFELELAIKKKKSIGLVPLFILCSPEDIDIARSLRSKFGGGLLFDISFSDLLALFPYAQCVISMRYHPLLAARACSVPFIPIGNDSKLLEFFDG